MDENLTPPYAKGGWGVKLIQVSVFISVIVALSALIQRWGGLGDLLPPVDRIYGTVGNAGLFAGYMLFNIFLSGYLAVSSFHPILAGDSSVATLPQNDKKRSGHPECSEGSLAHARLKFIVYC